MCAEGGVRRESYLQRRKNLSTGFSGYYLPLVKSLTHGCELHGISRLHMYGCQGGFYSEGSSCLTRKPKDRSREQTAGRQVRDTVWSGGETQVLSGWSGATRSTYSLLEPSESLDSVDSGSWEEHK